VHKLKKMYGLLNVHVV